MPEGTGLPKERKAIVDYLEQTTEAAGPKEIAEALNKTEGSVKNLLPKMVDDGQIGSSGRGEYFAYPQPAKISYLGDLAS